MGAMASQITRLMIVYAIAYPDADQRNHQSSAPLAFVRIIHLLSANTPQKWPATQKRFPFDDVIRSLSRLVSVTNVYALMFRDFFPEFGKRRNDISCLNTSDKFDHEGAIASNMRIMGPFMTLSIPDSISTESIWKFVHRLSLLLCKR